MISTESDLFGANQVASLERRENAAITVEDPWRGVGEPRR